MRGLLILVLVSATPAVAQDLPALHDVTGVAAGDVLNIRAAPSTSAAVVGTLAPDARGIEVVAVTGSWAILRRGDGAGYAAQRFLAPQSGPAWWTLQGRLSCHGTEPFWSLSLDPAGGTALLTSPEGPDQQMAIGQLWPAVRPGAPAALSLGQDGAEGSVVLRAAACGDGMSDAPFGIAADLMLPTRDGVLVGCCGIAAR